MSYDEESKPERIREGIITKVERQKRSAERYNIYVQDEYAFAVHEDVLLAYQLLKGKEITLEEIKLILEEEKHKKAERAAYYYLGFRPRTRKELEDYLIRKEYTRETVRDVIHKLEAEGYLNDTDFAQKWAAERLRLKQKGPLLIKEELKQKGVALSVIEAALQQVEYEEQEAACLRTAEKKWKQIKNKYSERYEQKQKLMLYLQRRGYTFDLIRATVEKLEES